MKFFTSVLLCSLLFSLSERYHTFYEIEEKLHEWEVEFSENQNPWPSYYPDSGIIYQLYELGRTETDNLPIYAVKLSYNANQDEDEARVLILGQCHAEEIYGVEIAMELIDWLLHPNAFYPVGYPDRKMAIENTEIWVVPTHNPEGLLTVHGDVIDDEWIQDEWYRKNKTDINMNDLFDYVHGPGNDSDGVDLNRNYDFNWIFGDDQYELDYGCSDNPSYIANFDYFRGSHPFSEKEIQIIRDFAIEKQFLLSIAYHSSRSGCVSEKVIYPWLWTEDKASPDFPVIDQLGRDIASLLPTQDGIATYLPSGSISRRGNAHDWFYSQTGCIQYLIEAGTSDMQSDSLDIIEDTVDRNLIGAFHLINRASGNNFGEIGADKYLINGIVKEFNTSETLNAEVKILEMDGPMLKPRKTDQFGRYRRLLYPGSFTLEVSHRGYGTYIEDGIVPSSTSFITRNIELVPLPEYSITFNFNFPEHYTDDFSSLQLIYRDQWGEIIQDISSGDIITFYEAMNEIEIRDPNSSLILPIFDEFYVNEDLSLNYDINWSKMLYKGIISNDWVFESGDWSFGENIKSQSSLFYDDNYQGLTYLDSSLMSNGYLVALIDAQYELEWDLDIFKFSFYNQSNELVSEFFLSSQHMGSDDKMMFFSDEDNQTLKLNMEIDCDPSLYYRGVIVNDLEILTLPNGECQYGDINHDGIININDVMKLLNYALSYEYAEGYYRCVSDINNDEAINIQDIINLVFMILGDQ